MRKMDDVGCDLFLDIHGDEEIPFNFLAGSEGIPSFNERLRDLQNTFSTAFVRASPDFQPKPGYTVDEPGKANLAISSNGVNQAHAMLQVFVLSKHRHCVMSVCVFVCLHLCWCVCLRVCLCMCASYVLHDLFIINGCSSCTDTLQPVGKV